MINPELLSNDELERIAYQRGDPLLIAMAARICELAEENEELINGPAGEP